MLDVPHVPVEHARAFLANPSGADLTVTVDGSDGSSTTVGVPAHGQATC